MKKKKRQTTNLIIALAIPQAILAILQRFGFYFLIPNNSLSSNSAVVGTVGNSEFLATFLAVALILAIFRIKNIRQTWAQPLIYISTILLIGIFSAASKGTLVILSILATGYVTKSKKWVSAVGVSSILLAALISSTSVFGRLSLWVVSLYSGFRSLPFGQGVRQFGNNYFPSIEELFRFAPSASKIMGTHSSTVLDSHNVFLNQLNELGIIGLVLTGIFVIAVLKKSLLSGGAIGATTILLLIKSQYTVLLNSLVGGVIFCLLAGFLFSEELPLKSNNLERKHHIKFAALFTGIIVSIGLILSVNSDFYYSQSLKLAKIGHSAESYKAFSKSAFWKPNADAHVGMAYAAFQEQNMELMSKHIAEALEITQNMNTLKISAHMYFYSGLYSEAEELYRKINIVFPEHLTSMTKLAMIYFRDKDLEKAQEFASKVLQTQPRVKMASDKRNIETAMEIARLTSLLKQREDQQ